MLELKVNHEVNGALYRLIKRTDKVALFSIHGGKRFEVTRIYVYPKTYVPNWLHHYPEREAISNNSQFQKDGSKQFRKEEDALVYFDKLNLLLHDQDKKDISTGHP